MHPLTRYIVSLGWEGFGDRLQCLSYCIALALSRNRVLVVNWSDRYFGGPFDDYFDLVGIPFASKQPPGETHPSIFKHLSNQPADDWVYDLDAYRIDDSQSFVTVHCGAGFRSYNTRLLELHLRFNDQTKLEIIDEMSRLRSISQLPIVHLRGTDRPWKHEDICNLAEKYGDVAILGDDQRAIDAYCAQTNSVSLSAARSDNKPIHKSGSSRERNIRMLADFCLIHEYGVGCLNEASLFYRMAKDINVNEWFEPSGTASNYSEFTLIS